MSTGRKSNSQWTQDNIDFLTDYRQLLRILPIKVRLKRTQKDRLVSGDSNSSEKKSFGNTRLWQHLSNGVVYVFVKRPKPFLLITSLFLITETIQSTKSKFI